LNVCAVGRGEIVTELLRRLWADGWREESPYSLLILGRGTMEPIGKLFDTDPHEWLMGVVSNGVGPLGSLRALWSQMADGGQVVFLGGPNQSKPCETYSAYKCGKAILEAIVPTLNAEYPEHRFHILNPGVVATKFHQQTIRAGDRAANLERVKRIVSGEEKTVTHDEVYQKLRALIA
jgi:NADP-dependent 3-hydroxy acid dehydrogenase YdfG